MGPGGKQVFATHGPHDATPLAPAYHFGIARKHSNYYPHPAEMQLLEVLRRDYVFFPCFEGELRGRAITNMKQ